MILPTSSSNFTNVTSQHSYHGWWATAAVLSKVFIAVEGYILLSLALFELRVGLKNKRGQGNNRHTSVKTDSIANLMRHLCLTASFFILLRSITELLEIHEGQHSDLYCNATRYAEIIMNCGAITCLYLVLWLRQRQFYKLPTFKHLYGRAIRFFSASVVVIMAAANVITITLYLATRQFRSSEQGCIIAWSSVWVKLPGLLFFIFTTSFQVILVSLLLHPLIKHGRASSRSTGYKQVKRVSIAALVAITTTITVSLVSPIFSHQMYGVVQQLINNLNILVTFLSILFSFNDWKCRLFCVFFANKEIVSTAKVYKNSSSGPSSAKVWSSFGGNHKKYQKKIYF